MEDRRGEKRFGGNSPDGAVRGSKFGWIIKYSREKPLSWKLDTLAGVPKCSIEAADDPSWPSFTQKLFKSAPNRKVTILTREFCGHGRRGQAALRETRGLVYLNAGCTGA